MESPLKFPEMRVDLTAYAESLHDVEHQKSVWVGQSPSSRWDNLDEVIHFFYDDTSLAQDSYKWIGLVLRDEEEAAAVAELTNELDSLFAEYGTGKSDLFYISSPRWQHVVKYADKLLSYLRTPDIVSTSP